MGELGSGIATNVPGVDALVLTRTLGAGGAHVWVVRGVGPRMRRLYDWLATVPHEDFERPPASYFVLERGEDEEVLLREFGDFIRIQDDW